MNPTTRNFSRTFDLALGILALTVALIAVTCNAQPAMALLKLNANQSFKVAVAE